MKGISRAEIIIIVAIAVLLTAGHYYLTRHTIVVGYDLYSDKNAVTQIYWSSADGLSENKRVDLRVKENTLTEIRYPITDTSTVTWIRIDPLKAPGNFKLDNLHVKFIDALLPFFTLNRINLHVEAALEKQQVKKINQHLYEYESSGLDPYFLFKLETHAHIKNIFINFFFALGAMFLVVFGARLFSRGAEESGQRRIPLETLAYSTSMFLMFVGFFVIALASVEFVQLGRYSREVIYGVFVLWFIFYTLSILGFVNSKVIPYTCGLLLIVLIILPDALFHFGVLDRPVFSVKSTPLYYWRVNKSSKDNLFHSSIRYYADFEKIKDLVIPDSYFLSDVATTYYVSAALPLYGVNVHRHHQYNVVKISRKDVGHFCDENAEESRKLVERYLRKKAESHNKRGLAPLRYIFLNKDKQNRHVASSCLARRHELIKANLDSILMPVYQGEFIDVYEFRVR